ncbi:hypothetical protein [Absidia glauca]|uniref:Uncharacterized protein n=1 Tax=Absidia glauca TaxID=4829 RepID=A0A168QIN8_ABSGL|nr:hypothetical protein [Absidia glauca]
MGLKNHASKLKPTDNVVSLGDRSAKKKEWKDREMVSHTHTHASYDDRLFPLSTLDHLVKQKVGPRIEMGGVSKSGQRLATKKDTPNKVGASLHEPKSSADYDNEERPLIRRTITYSSLFKSEGGRRLAVSNNILTVTAGLTTCEPCFYK